MGNIFCCLNVNPPPMENINNGDRIILVIGQPKAGKTSFIKSVTGEDPCKGEMNGIQHFIIPGNGHSPTQTVLAELSLKSETVETKLLTWLQNLSAKGLTLSGILHLHRIGDDTSSLARTRRMLKNVFDETGRGGPGDPPTRTMLVATKVDGLATLSAEVRTSWLDAWAGPGAISLVPEFDVALRGSGKAGDIVSALLSVDGVAREETKSKAREETRDKAREETDEETFPREGDDENSLKEELEQLMNDREELEKKLEGHDSAAEEARKRLEVEWQRRVAQLEEQLGKLQEMFHWLTKQLDDPQRVEKIQKLQRQINELKDEKEKERREYERKLEEQSVRAERERQELLRKLEECLKEEKRLLYKLGKTRERLLEQTAKHQTVERLEGLLRDANEREKREQRLRDLEAEDARFARQREVEERGKREAAEARAREMERTILEHQQEINRLSAAL